MTSTRANRWIAAASIAALFTLTGCKALDEFEDRLVGAVRVLIPDEKEPSGNDEGEAPPQEEPGSEEPPPTTPPPDDGGGEDPTPTDPPGEEEPTPTDPPEEPTSPRLDAEELSFLQELNAYRATRGLGALQVSVGLTDAAEFHSTDMAQGEFMSHDSSDGTTFGDRVRRFYTGWTAIAENVAAGYTTGVSVFGGWKGSSGHHANMVNGKYRAIGISRVRSASGRWYWTTDFGDRVDAIVPYVWVEAPRLSLRPPEAEGLRASSTRLER